MADLNKVLLMGRLTRDPEFKTIGSGTSLTEMSLATNRTWMKDGEKKEETTFVDVVIWGNQAESSAKYLSKGSSCFIEGRLNFDSWDDKDTGKKRSKLNVVADRVQFLDPKGSGEPYQESTKESQQKFANQMEENFDVDSDSIPF